MKIFRFVCLVGCFVLIIGGAALIHGITTDKPKLTIVGAVIFFLGVFSAFVGLIVSSLSKQDLALKSLGGRLALAVGFGLLGALIIHFGVTTEDFELIKIGIIALVPGLLCFVVLILGFGKPIPPKSAKDSKSKPPAKKYYLANGWALVKRSIDVLAQYPRLMIPLLFCWLIYAPLILGLKFFVPWKELSVWASIGICFGAIFLMSFMLALSCLVLLELLQQMNYQQRPSFFRALRDTIVRDFLKALPIICAWSLIWIMLTIIQAIFRSDRHDDKQDDVFTAENAARTLTGLGGGFSLSEAFFVALKKGVRMIVFLILPAIAWEDQRPREAMRRGFVALKAHLAEFSVGFVLTDLAALLVILPAAIVTYIPLKFEFQLPDMVWMIVIIYSAFAWSFSMFIEQMFAAELYHWHLEWVKACKHAQQWGGELPNFREMKPKRDTNLVRYRRIRDRSKAEPELIAAHIGSSKATLGREGRFEFGQPYPHDDDPRKCNRCGAQIDEFEAVCPNCGRDQFGGAT